MSIRVGAKSKKLLDDSLTILIVTLLSAFVLMFAAPFFHAVIGSPKVHPGFFGCWLVTILVRVLVQGSKELT